MSDLQGAWAGELGVFKDAGEKKVLFATLDSFRQYRKNFYALPSSEWKLLSAPPFNFLSTLEQVDDAIDANADIATEILKTGLESFGLNVGSPLEPAHWHGEAKASDLDKARSTIRQFFRDWSSEGSREREASYGPVLQDIDVAFADISEKGSTKILVPGAGLGRLVFEICKQGYDVEGNEISYHQLLSSSWILNQTEQAEQYTLFPFASDFSNVVSRADQLKMVKIPDVHPATALADNDVRATKDASDRMKMIAADFAELYSTTKNRKVFDAVATVYFLDTGNVIKYIQTVYNCLKPGGIWINNGPLLWHGPSHGEERTGSLVHNHESASGTNWGPVELSVEEVLMLVSSMGFEIDDKGITHEGSEYIGNSKSLLQNLYRTSHWIARKVA
ncbi:MAG: hypothetical protein Q9166_007510 [cf. Caloplaca sp. 2 TL-2023]